jgi:lysophospholipase L1-like esterase
MISSQAFKNLALVAGSVLFVFALFEVFLRLFHPQVFEVHPQGMYLADDEAGYVLAPNFEGTIERAEFLTTITVNNAGLRGPRLEDRRDGAYRILVLGDSFAFGFGTEDDETFSVGLERCLNESGGGSYEVLNAGIPGYGTVDQLNFLRSRGAELAPDLVILQFLSSNDLDENRYPAVEWADVEDGWLVSRNYDPATLLPLWKRFEYWIKGNFHSVKFISARVGYVLLKSSLFPELERAFWGERFAEEEERLFEEALSRIKEHAEGLGAELLFLYATGQGPVVAREEPVLDSEALVSRVVSAHEVDWLNSFRLMRANEDRMNFYYPADGHWNPAGHRFVGEILCGEVLARH